MTEDLVSLIFNPVTQFNSQQLSTSFHAAQVWICHGPLQHRRQITDHEFKIHQSREYLEEETVQF